MKNQGATDAYLAPKGSKTDKTYKIYVGAGEQVIMEHIPDGSYEVYLTIGTIWVSYERRFKDAVSYKKLKEPLIFTQASLWEIILQTVEGGNTGRVPINENDFP